MDGSESIKQCARVCPQLVALLLCHTHSETKRTIEA